MRTIITLTLLLLATSLALAAPIELNLPPVIEPPIEPPVAPPPPVGEPFTIGHLRNSDEYSISSQDFDQLRQILSRDPAMRRFLQQFGLGSIEIVGTDTHRDLLRRMNGNEFDMVFAPSLVFVQQTGGYEVLAQLGDPDVVGTAARGMGLLRTSVIFANRSSALFGAPTPGSAQWHEQSASLVPTVEAQSMAVVSASSALGFVVPLLSLREDCDLSRDPHTVFFDSPEETVMAVLNNLVPMGACDRATFDRVVAEWTPDVNPDDLIRVVIETSPMPTSPVVIRGDYHPMVAGPGVSVLRDALANALDEIDASRFQLVDANARVFVRLNPVVQAFYGEGVSP